MNHLGTMELESKRLLLRKFTLSDAKMCFQNWTSDKKVVRYLRWKTHTNIYESENILKNWCEKYTNPTFYQWAICLKDELSLGPIGTISVNKYDNHIDMVHLGFCIGSKWWNKGISSEALSLVISFLFEQVKANRIESWHDPKNIYSGKVMAKCGMNYEGTLKSADYNNHGIVDACVYAILANEVTNLSIDTLQESKHCP